MLYKKLTRGIKGRVARCNLLNSTLFRNWSDVRNLLYMLNKAEIKKKTNNDVELKLHRETA